MTLTVSLPPETKAREVAAALATLFGEEGHKVETVQGAPWLCQLTAGSWHATYDFEGYKGSREMRLLPNSFWCCAATHLVKAFGGAVVIQHPGKLMTTTRKTPPKPRRVKRMTNKELNQWRVKLARWLREDEE